MQGEYTWVGAGEYGCCLFDRVPDANQAITAASRHSPARCASWITYTAHEVEPNHQRRRWLTGPVKRLT
jgi:hypothetical protein